MGLSRANRQKENGSLILPFFAFYNGFSAGQKGSDT